MLDLRSKGTFNVKQQHQQRSPPSEPSDAWSGFDGRGGGGGGSAGDWGVWGNAYDSSRSLRKKGDSWLDAVKAGEERGERDLMQSLQTMDKYYRFFRCLGNISHPVKEAQGGRRVSMTACVE